MTRSKLHIFRAEQNTLNAVLRNNGGRYTAADAAAAQTFRRKCYSFINVWTEQAGSPTPYEQLEIALPAKGQPTDNLSTVRIRAALPPGKRESFDGRVIPGVHEIGATQPVVQIPEDQTSLDIDLDDITNSLFDE